jgi:hypothetical protein
LNKFKYLRYNDSFLAGRIFAPPRDYPRFCLIFEQETLPTALSDAVAAIHLLKFCAMNPSVSAGSCCFSRAFQKTVKISCVIKIRPLEFDKIQRKTTRCSGLQQLVATGSNWQHLAATGRTAREHWRNE